MYDDLKNMRTDNKAIRDFGILVGFILLIIAGILFYKEGILKDFSDIFNISDYKMLIINLLDLQYIVGLF